MAPLPNNLGTKFIILGSVNDAVQCTTPKSNYWFNQ